MATVIEGGGGIGESLAATSSDLLQLMLQQRRLDLRERAVESREERRDMLSDLGTAELLFNATPPDATVAESPLAQEGLRLTVGRALGEDFSPAEDPRFRDIKVNPLSPDQRVDQMRLDFIEELRGSENPEDQRAARLLQEAIVTEPFEDVKNLQDLQLHEQEGALSERGLRLFDTITRPTIDGEENPLFDQNKLFNLASQAVGLPTEVEFVGPEGQTFQFPKEVASTVAGEIWGNFFDERELSITNQQERMDSMVDSLVTQMDNAGVSIGEGLARKVIGLSMATGEELQSVAEKDPVLVGAVGGDPEATQRLMQNRPEVGATVQAFNQGLVRAEGLQNVQIAQMHPTMRSLYTSGIGLLNSLSESVPKSEILETADQLTENMREVAEIYGIDPESIPRFRKGILGFNVPLINRGGLDVQLPRQDATAVQGGEGEGGEGEGGEGDVLDTTAGRDSALFDAAQQIVSGEMTEGQARVELDLDREGLMSLRELIAVLEARQGGENE